MPWIEFTGTFRWRPKSNVSLRYLTGMRVNVTQRCAEAAIAKGAAINSTDPDQEAKRGKRNNHSGVGQAAAQAGAIAESGEDPNPKEDGGGGGRDRRDDEKPRSGPEVGG